MRKGDQVISEDPAQHGSGCRGTEKSAEDLVGPPERMESERREKGRSPNTCDYFTTYSTRTRMFMLIIELTERPAW